MDFRGQVNIPLSLDIPRNAYIGRGAVLRGATRNVVSSRKARRHYGIAARTQFDAKRDPLDCRVWDPFEEQWKATNRMSWFVAKVELSHTIDVVQMLTMLGNSNIGRGKNLAAILSGRSCWMR